MTEQHRPADFSSTTSTLVPGVLRAYRHFRVWPGGHPFGLGGTAAGQGRRPDLRLWACNVIFTSARTYLGAGPHTAICTKFSFPFPSEGSRCADGTAPNPSCHCGFYAYYDPRHDFYRTSTGWYVKAVVELSGRILMGSLGVRAERMEIKAIAPDLGKVAGIDSTVTDACLRAAEETDHAARRAELTRHTQAVASANGLVFHPSVEVLVGTWPRPDLSAVLEIAGSALEPAGPEG